MFTLSLALAMQLQYPDANRTDFKETLFGTEVADPYRWMEEMESPEVKTWVQAENKLTRSVLDVIPGRAALEKRYKVLFNYPKFGEPFRMGDRYFWTENTGLQNQDVYYWGRAVGKGKKVLIDPNKLSKDGTVALSGVSISDDGKYLAYSISKGGSDWQEWKVRDIGTGKDLSDHILWSKFSGASWDHAGKGFYYSAYEAPKEGNALSEQNYYQKLYYHRLGTSQKQDKLVYERKDQKEWGFGGEVTEDGKYLVITVWQGTERENRVFVKPLSGSGKVQELLNKADAGYQFLGNAGQVLYFSTDLNAPNSRIVAISLSKPGEIRTIIPEAKEPIESASMLGGRLVLRSLKDAHSLVSHYDLNGKNRKDVKLPGIGAASGFSGHENDPITYYTYMSFDRAPTIYRYSVKTGRSSVVFASQAPFDPEKFETKQVFYPSKDGTKIPMFLTYKKGLKLNGQNPTLLYAYGGFNIPTTPFFSASRLLWMEMGGVSAVACIRGGGEYGKAWHDGGRLKNKQNCFDDFIAGAEWLIGKGYTSTPKLAIQGGSNGGLLIGACMTQRPDLFGACLPEVGVLDMLRFHKFTIGWGWVSDFGSPDKEDDFRVLLKYSPYHNVKPASYPPTLIITGDHDDRVVPLHSFKFAAELQHQQQGDAPVLIRIETQAGHGAGKPTAKIIEEIVDKWSFLSMALKMKPMR